MGRRPRARLADYDPATDRYTGQRSLNDPWLRDLLRVGRDFWASRGVQVPERIALDVSDDLSGPDTVGQAAVMGRVMGRAWPAGDGEGRIALDANLVTGSLRRAQSRRRSTADRRAALRELASTLIHEQGHVGGVQHVEGDEAGFMGTTGGADVVPDEIASEVRRLIKRRKGERVSRRTYGIG